MIQIDVICLRDILAFVLSQIKYSIFNLQYGIIKIYIVYYYLVVGSKKIKRLPTFSWMMFLKPCCLSHRVATFTNEV